MDIFQNPQGIFAENKETRDLQYIENKETRDLKYIELNNKDIYPIKLEEQNVDGLGFKVTHNARVQSFTKQPSMALKKILPGLHLHHQNLMKWSLWVKVPFIM